METSGGEWRTSEKIFRVAEEELRMEEKIKDPVRHFRKGRLIIDDSLPSTTTIEPVESIRRRAWDTEACSYACGYPMTPVPEYRSMNSLSDTKYRQVFFWERRCWEDFRAVYKARIRIICWTGWSDRYFLTAMLISNTDSLQGRWRLSGL